MSEKPDSLTQIHSLKLQIIGLMIWEYMPDLLLAAVVFGALTVIVL